MFSSLFYQAIAASTHLHKPTSAYLATPVSHLAVPLSVNKRLFDRKSTLDHVLRTHHNLQRLQRTANAFDNEEEQNVMEEDNHQAMLNHEDELADMEEDNHQAMLHHEEQQQHAGMEEDNHQALLHYEEQHQNNRDTDPYDCDNNDEGIGETATTTTTRMELEDEHMELEEERSRQFPFMARRAMRTRRSDKMKPEFYSLASFSAAAGAGRRRRRGAGPNSVRMHLC